MRKILLLTVVLALAGFVGFDVTSAKAASPALQAKRAEAEAVLQRVNALGVRFGHVVDAWDGARIELAKSERQLSENKVALVRARRQSRLADARLAQVLVAIYEHGVPSLPEIVVGASSMSDVVDGIEAARTVDAYDRRLAAQAKRWQGSLTAARVGLKRIERTRRRTVAQLSGARRQIGSMLAERRRLLASVQGEVNVLEAQQAARQRALAEAARARLRAAEAAAAKAAAARAAIAAPAATTTTTAATTTTTSDGTTTLATVTTTAPAPSLGPGHPQAASIALGYLGVRYTWGGASPGTGFDCSGLVMYVYAQLGIQLPHQAAAQYGYGVAVPLNQLQPGDLVFYDGLSHVAIYIGNGEIVHAPQTGDVVKIAPLQQGGLSIVGARRL
jgi:peptidoglycan DL-endopeptidase CwlO